MNEKKCFSITWKIENFSYFWQNNGECFKSPVFVADTIGKSKWRLSIYPKGDRENEKDFICFYLTREDCNAWGNNLDINFELSFLATDDSVLISEGRNYKSSFLQHKSWGFRKFVKCEEVLKIRRKDYLSKNVLTARCRMRENNGVIDYGHCFAWTRIAVERRSFVWNIKQFSSFQESVCDIPSTSAEQSVIKLKFFPSLGQNSETIIRVKFCDHIQSLKILTFRIHLVDISENRVECVSGEIVFKADIENTSFTLTFSKEELTKNKNRYLPSDVLQLHCECFFSNGIMLEEIKNISFECPLSIQKGNSTSDSWKSKEMLLDSVKTLKENLESSYKENLLCDTKLKTETGSFPANKFILSTRSPVFKAMFTNDMREKNSEYVMIEDLDDDTVQRMLQFMYTATMPDLQWDSACNLYAAADKYEILSLKSKCAFFLKDNLTQDNACDVLILADMHQDQELKSAIQYYILNHRDIFNTKEWELFMKTNLQLAANLMHLKLTEKM